MKILNAGPRFDEVGPDGVRRIGYRAGRALWAFAIFTGIGKTEWFYTEDFYLGRAKLGPGGRGGRSYFIEACPEQVIWTIRPDGSATYSREFLEYGFETRAEFLATLSASKSQVQQYLPPGDDYPGPTRPGLVYGGKLGGSPLSTYNFSPDGLKAFRMVASLYPDGVVDRGIWINGMNWPAWEFPFTAQDSAAMRQWVTKLSPADAFAIYYTLMAFDGNESHGCKLRKYNPTISPPEFESNYFWSVFQEMVFMSIYNIRTDLHKVRDPDTGNVIDGLIRYDLFTRPCKAGVGEIIFGVISSLALAVVTAGAGAALSTALKTIDLAKTIYDMKSDADRAKATAAFTNSVIKGYSAGTDIQNILQPPPKLTPAEEALIAKAEGKTPPASQPAVTGAQRGTFPWWIVAGAAALLLS